MERLFEFIADRPFTVVFWDGRERAFGQGQPQFVIHIKSQKAALKILATFDLGFGEAYMDGDIDVIGELASCMSLAYTDNARKVDMTPLKRALLLLLALRNSNSLSGARRNIAHHYDLGNDFYTLWLDPQLQYTCAYFTNPQQSLADAQRSKMDLVCRKLRLQPGQSLLETGCGWGGFAIHAARHYGVTVKAYNISAEQIVYARRLAEVHGVSDRVDFIEDDYRNARGHFDAFASIGMLEHVGRDHYQHLCQVIGRTLKPGGRGLLHFIGKNAPRPLSSWLTTYIFPGAYAPALQELLPIMGQLGLVTTDVHNLRLHYKRTLEHWLAQFEQRLPVVRQTFDERFIRMWRFYLCGSIAAFHSGSVQLYQVLFTNGQTTDLALCRQHHEPLGDLDCSIHTWNDTTSSSWAPGRPDQPVPGP